MFKPDALKPKFMNALECKLGFQCFYLRGLRDLFPECWCEKGIGAIQTCTRSSERTVTGKAIIFVLIHEYFSKSHCIKENIACEVCRSQFWFWVSYF